VNSLIGIPGYSFIDFGLQTGSGQNGYGSRLKIRNEKAEKKLEFHSGPHSPIRSTVVPGDTIIPIYSLEILLQAEMPANPRARTRFLLAIVVTPTVRTKIEQVLGLAGISACNRISNE
jgi:hypothetical protein